MSYLEVMQLPLRTFWLMNSNVERLMAQKDMRAMSVSMISQASPEDATRYRQHLMVEAGTVVKLQGSEAAAPVEEERDESGFAELKMMARM